MRSRSIPRQLLRLLHLFIVPITYALTRLAERSPALVDAIYSSKIYPVIRDAVSFLTRYVPFSVAEISVCLLAAAIVIIALIRVIRLILIKKGALVEMLSFVISLLLAAGYLFFAFYAMWGFNYYRLTAAEKLDLPDRQYTSEELYSVCLDLASKAKELREQVRVDTGGVFCGDLDSMDDAVVEAYKTFGESRPSFKANVPPAKHIIASEFFNRCGISGIYIFLTEEPNINVNEPFLYIPFSAAHETAHYLGYAREQDANFIAFLVCRDAKDASVSYSGYMHALVNCGNALASADKDLYGELWSTYSEGMKADFADYSEYYNRYADTDTWNASNDLNDSYLKFNDQEKGVLSYSEDVGLILRFYDSIGFFRQ